MKNTDIAAIVLIAVIFTLGAYYVVDKVVGDPYERRVNVEYMDKISSTILQPDPEVFNRDAINPTVEVWIGQGSEGNNQTGDDTEEEGVN
jgi:hypothetical protein